MTGMDELGDRIHAAILAALPAAGPYVEDRDDIAATLVSPLLRVMGEDADLAEVMRRIMQEATGHLEVQRDVLYLGDDASVLLTTRQELVMRRAMQEAGPPRREPWPKVHIGQVWIERQTARRVTVEDVTIAGRAWSVEFRHHDLDRSLGARPLPVFQETFRLLEQPSTLPDAET